MSLATVGRGSGADRAGARCGERTPWQTPLLADARGVVFVTRPVVAGVFATLALTPLEDEPRHPLGEIARAHLGIAVIHQ